LDLPLHIKLVLAERQAPQMEQILGCQILDLHQQQPLRALLQKAEAALQVRRLQVGLAVQLVPLLERLLILAERAEMALLLQVRLLAVEVALLVHMARETTALTA
jgi:hypothetical protein